MKRKDDYEQGPTAQWLLDLIEQFLTKNDLDNDGDLFGWVVMKDRTLVERLRDGGDVTTGNMEKILAFMQKPVPVVRTGSRKGLIRHFNLKPITIKPKELP